MSDDYFIRKVEAARRFGVTVRTLERWERAGIFPRRMQIGPLAVGYRASELEEFAKSRQYAARRDSTAAAAPEAAEFPSSKYDATPTRQGRGRNLVASADESQQCKSYAPSPAPRNNALSD